ncbi:hypothetical protein BDB01DRAFT_844883 [Pilobolus umbonatus]|nr:hypothetical protein BDB01DRAFT_844883 [Pilobolus umbonatus]
MAKNVATKPVVKITVEEDDDFQTSSKYFQPEKDTLDEIKIPIEPPPATLPRIFVGSRTHKQLTQLVSELKKKTPYRPRMTVLGSREQLCIHPKVKKSADKAEDCKNLLDTNSCYYAHKTRKLMAHPSLHNEHKVWDIEDLVKLGNRVSGCPYYASRKLYDQAEVVFCPYNYILDPVIRKILDIKLKDSIIILDEAHNIEDASRSAGSFEINELALNSIAIQCDILSHSDILPTSHNQIGDFIRKFHTWMTSKQKFTIREFDQHLNLWSGYEIIQLLVSLDITPFFFTEIIIPAFIEVQSHAETMRKEAEKKSTDDVELEEGQIQQPDSSQERGPRIKYLTNASLTALQGIIMILGYLFREDKQYYNDYKMVLINKKDRKENKRHKEKELIWTLKLGFWCMNPGIIFQELTNDTRSVILTSGTLSPLDTFSSELETDFPRQLEANHVIGPSQVWAAVVPKGPNNGNLLGTYTQVDKYQYQDEVGESILRIIQTVPFGVLCFMSSYALMEKLIKRWKETGLYKRMNAAKTIYTESKVSDKKVFDKTLKNFYSEIDGYTANYNTKKNGCLFFAVYRGKVSEGIDFSDNYCRAVIAIGIPFPAM